MMWKKEIKNIVPYFLLIVISVMVVCHKENFHTDEIFSYGLANCQTGIKMDFVDGFRYDCPEEPWMNFITVDESSRFDYANVWTNQAEDVHPPLYYVIVHTICSVFPGRFSIWFAASINIVFALLSLYMVRRLTLKLTEKEEIAFAVSMVFALTPGIYNSISFLRMYVMVMFEVLWVTYWFIDALEKPKLRVKSCLTLLLITVIGTMTHYYFIVYLVFLCIILGLYLLMSKRWKEMVLFVGDMAASAAVAIAMFPAMLEHIFSGYRGEESFRNLANGGWNEYQGRLVSFWGFINNQVFGGLLFYILAAIMVCIIVGYFVGRFKRGSYNFQKEQPCAVEKKIRVWQWCMLIMPSVCYFFLVSKVAVYVTDRYIFPIYAVCLLTVLGSLILIVTQYAKGIIGWIICSLICIVIAGCGWKISSWQYLYSNFDEFLEKTKEYSNLDCIVVYDGNKWKLQPNVYEIRNYRSVTFVSVYDWETLDKLPLRDLKEAVVVTIGDHETALDALLCRAPYMNAYDIVDYYSYSATYHVYGQDLQTQSYHIWDYEHGKQIGWELKDDGSLNVQMNTQGAEVLYVDNMTSQEDYLWMADKVFDIQGGTFVEDNNVLLYTVNHGANQMWSIVMNEDGSATILASDKQFALTRNENGNVIISAYVQGKQEQKWWLE